MRSRFIATGLISAVLLAVIPANSSANSKYYKNTHREGFEFTANTILEVWDDYEHIYSTSTGKIISSKLAKYCKTVKFYDQLTFSPNAQKGCIAAFKKYGATG